MSVPDWPFMPFEEVVRSRGSGNSGLPQKEWEPEGKHPVIGQGAEEVEGWSNRDDLLVEPGRGLVLYGGHTRRAKHVVKQFVPGPNVKILQPSNGLEPRFLYYYLSYLPIPSKGYADHFPLVRQSGVPVPPLAEQQRIVGKLDAAFAALAEAQAHVVRNRANARELFESYLNGVFEGNGDGWVEKELGTICEVKDGTHDSPRYLAEGIPFVTQKNVTADGLSLENTRFISQEDHDNFYRRSNAAYGDILISMIGANRGMACLIDNRMVFSIKNVGLVKRNDAINERYLLAYLKSARAAEFVRSKSKGGAQEFIGLTELRKFPIIIPSRAEQDALADKFDALSQETKELETTYQQKQTELAGLKKAVLGAAFRGEL